MIPQNGGEVRESGRGWRGCLEFRPALRPRIKSPEIVERGERGRGGGEGIGGREWTFSAEDEEGVGV